MKRSRGSPLALAVAALCSVLAHNAAAQSSTQECIDAYEDGQRLQLQEQLKQAATQFAHCAGSACPAIIQGECQRLLDQLGFSAPQVTFRVLDAYGEELGDVRVAIDGGKSQVLAGQALRVNPGEHQFVFERDGYRSEIRRIRFSKDDEPKRRAVQLSPQCTEPPNASVESDLPAAPANTELASRPNESASPVVLPPKPRSSTPGETPALQSRWSPLLIGTSAVSALGGLGFIYFGVQARSADRSLDECAPICARARTEAVKRDYLLANTSLGVGIVGGLGTGLLWLTGKPTPDSSRKLRASRPGQWSLRLGSITTLSTTY